MLPLGAMHVLTGGWSTTYLFVVPQADPVALDRIVSYARHDLPRSMGALGILFLLAVVIYWRWGLALKSNAFAWLLFALLAIFVSGWARARLGGNTNSLMPAYAFLCLVPSIVLTEAAQLQVLRPQLRAALAGSVYLAVLLQCALGLYNPVREIPTAAMWQSGERLITALRQSPGPVLVLEHPYYALLSGKAPSVALTALWHATARGATALPLDLRQRFADRYYALIIGDEGTYPEVNALVADGWRDTYAAAQTLDVADAPATLDGLVVQPRNVYMPK